MKITNKEKHKNSKKNIKQQKRNLKRKSRKTEISQPEPERLTPLLYKKVLYYIMKSLAIERNPLL